MAITQEAPRSRDTPLILNTGYNSVVRDAFPSSDQSLPLGDHLLPAIVEKIWRGEFVDVFLLLRKESLMFACEVALEIRHAFPCFFGWCKESTVKQKTNIGIQD